MKKKVSKKKVIKKKVKVSHKKTSSKKEFTNNVCVLCSKIQKNCCNDYPMVPMTVDDINKIKKLGYKPKDFLIVQEYFPDDVIENEPWWGGSMVKINPRKNLHSSDFSGSHQTKTDEQGLVMDKMYKLNVKKKKDGSCVFLAHGKGCILGENRPAVCRIYPFWINYDGVIAYEGGEEDYCHIAKSGHHISEALNLIGENKSAVKNYYNEIKDDCMKNKKKHESLVKELLKIKR